MRTHSPAYRDRTTFFEPDDGTPGGVPASPSSSFFARAGREPAPDIRLGDLARADGVARTGDRPLSIALIGRDGAWRDALRFDRDVDVTRFSSAGELLTAFRHGQTSDVVLLEWHADMAAGDLLRELDMSDLCMPVAMLLGGHGDAASGETAADSHGPILDRIRFVADLLRGDTDATSRTDAPAAPGHLRLDTRTCRAFWKGMPVNLTITEFNIVSLFAQRAGENLSYREIYDVVHGPGFWAGDGANGYQTNVRSLIKRIRQKFHDADADFGEIENHRGYGYRWRTAEALAGDGTAKPRPLQIAQGEASSRGAVAPQALVLTGAALTLVMVVCLANSAAG